MKPEVKAAWVAALRSGEYEQGKGQLRHIDAFCCLGVLCDIAAKHGVGVWAGDAFDTDVIPAFAVPPPAVVAWAGLEYPNEPINGISIIYLNDGEPEFQVEPHTFAEIADLI